MKQLRRVAVVTGAASGMGLACVRRFANEGLAVALVDIDSRALDSAAAELPGDRGSFAFIRTDVSSAEDVAIMREQVREQLGPPAILVNAAGILRSTRFLDITEREWDRVINVSLKGTFLMCQALFEDIASAPNGRIVNFSSTAGKTVSTLGGAHYTAAKSGVLGLTRALAKEAAANGVTVNAVCPGLIDTDMVRSSIDDNTRATFAESFPISRLGHPDEVASLVSFLCSASAGYITGAALDINGGDLMV